ncbi:MAG: DUF6166 domain-containing protein [Cyclobacteriaceae bacterium]
MTIIKPDFDHEFFLVQLKTEDQLKAELDLLVIDSLVPKKENSDVIDLETYLLEIRSKRLRFQRAVDMSIQLRGDYDSRRVWLFENPISPVPSMQLRTHSMDGFNWGSLGPGSAQLSLALCLELFGVHRALKEYQDFKGKYLSTLPQSDFSLDIPIKLPAQQIEVVIESEVK